MELAGGQKGRRRLSLAVRALAAWLLLCGLGRAHAPARVKMGAGALASEEEPSGTAEFPAYHPDSLAYRLPRCGLERPMAPHQYAQKVCWTKTGGLQSMGVKSSSIGDSLSLLLCMHWKGNDP